MWPKDGRRRHELKWRARIPRRRVALVAVWVERQCAERDEIAAAGGALSSDKFKLARMLAEAHEWDYGCAFGGGDVARARRA